MNKIFALLLSLGSTAAFAVSETLDAPWCTFESKAGPVEIARLPFHIGVQEHEGIYCHGANVSALKRIPVMATGDSEPWVFRISGDFYDMSIMAYPESEGPASRRTVKKVIETHGNACAIFNSRETVVEFPELEVVKGKKIPVSFHCRQKRET